MKDAHDIIIAPYITEKSVRLSYGDPKIKKEEDIVRKYTFVVRGDANKIEIKNALEAIYNTGKKKDDAIVITSVRTIKIPGKLKRVRTKAAAYPKQGYQPDRKKAIVTLEKGQLLEDFGV